MTLVFNIAQVSEPVICNNELQPHMNIQCHEDETTSNFGLLGASRLSSIPPSVSAGQLRLVGSVLEKKRENLIERHFRDS